MKYLSLVLFTIALAWSWNLVHSQSTISFETHSGIQEKLAALIVDTIKTKKPSASDIMIEKIWTEVLSPEKVKAYFIYSFKENSEAGLISTQIHGEGILERKGVTEDGQDHWVLTNVQASSDAIQFDDATIVTGSSNSTEGNETETGAVTTEASPETVSTPASAPTTTAPAAPEQTEAPKTEEHH